ncbi:MAG: amidohydrolase family protein [Acidobacteria bacterium]|nr:amidohydrolase family protein [Acidobacteriota bacterium]
MRNPSYPGIFASGVMLSVMLCTLPGLQAQQDLPVQVLHYADLVLYNGKVLTADDKFTIAQAVAVRDGKFLALGDSATILRMAGPKTERIDLQGKTVVPGFCDPHSINLLGGVPAGGNALTWINDNMFEVGADSVDDLLRQIKRAVDSAKPGEWLFFGLPRNVATYQLNRKLLDTVTPDNPILATYDTTQALVNSQTLSLMPRDVKEGLFVDDQGEPTGHIRGWALGVLEMEVLPYPDDKRMEEMIQAQKEVFRKINSVGVTTVGSRAWGLSLTIVAELYRRAELPLRLRLTHEFGRQNPQMERYLKRMGNFMDLGNEWFKIAGATSTVVDSNPGNGGLFTRSPKRQRLPGDAFGPTGQDKWALMFQEEDGWKKEFQNTVLLGRYGWNVSDMHIIGDGGVELMVSAWDEINKTRPVRGKRFGMVHGGIRPPDLAKRLAQYDAALSLAPAIGFMGKGTEQAIVTQYGADQMAALHPIRSLIDAGLKPVLEVTNFMLGFGATTPIGQRVKKLATGRAARVEDAGGENSVAWNRYGNQFYMWNLEKFITRRNEATGKVWGPGERVTRQEALWMGTNWASRFYGDEKIVGTVEPGKLADLVILGGDYLTAPEEEISEIPVLQVMVGGKVTYEKPAAAAAGTQ